MSPELLLQAAFEREIQLLERRIAERAEARQKVQNDPAAVDLEASWHDDRDALQPVGLSEQLRSAKRPLKLVKQRLNETSCDDHGKPGRG